MNLNSGIPGGKKKIRHPNRARSLLWDRRKMGNNYIYHGPPKPTCSEVFMVNNLVFRWPNPVFFMALGAHNSE